MSDEFVIAVSASSGIIGGQLREPDRPGRIRQTLSCGEPPEGLADLIAWAQGLLEQVPVEHRAEAFLEHHPDDEYCCGWVAGWTRWETDAEFMARLKAKYE